MRTMPSGHLGFGAIATALSDDAGDGAGRADALGEGSALGPA
jgi:hypothetical protein